MMEQGIAPLVKFVETLRPGERDNGLFWASCRAVAEGLDTAPLVTAAEKTGLSQDKAQSTIESAVQHIAKARAEQVSG
jgi:hypothetical protein